MLLARADNGGFYNPKAYMATEGKAELHELLAGQAIKREEVENASKYRFSTKGAPSPPGELSSSHVKATAQSLMNTN